MSGAVCCLPREVTGVLEGFSAQVLNEDVSVLMLGNRRVYFSTAPRQLQLMIDGNHMQIGRSWLLIVVLFIGCANGSGNTPEEHGDRVT